MSESMIANFRRQLEEETTAMQRGLYGLALGTARHDCLLHEAQIAMLSRDFCAVAFGLTAWGVTLENPLPV